MPDSSWISLMVQIPIVGVFVWYSLEINKRMQEAQRLYMEALDKRDAEYEKRNKALIESITSLSMALTAEMRNLSDCAQEHDKFVRENVARRTGHPQPSRD